MDPGRPEWIDQVLAAKSLEVLQGVMGKAVNRLGFEHYIYRSRFPWLGQGHADLFVDRFPQGWRDSYVENGVSARTDPILQRALNRVRPVMWHEVLPDYPRLCRDARDYGLVTGITCPLHAPRGEWSAISVVNDRSGPGAERDSYAAMAECQLLACFAHDAAKRIIQADRRAGTRVQDVPRAPRITRREQDCLRWTANGKSAGQIGSLLGIAERTVFSIWATRAASLARQMPATRSQSRFRSGLSLPIRLST